MNGGFDNARAAAHVYLDLGLDPIPIRPRSKKPKREWSKDRLGTPEQIDRHFGPSDNVAVALGARSNGLIDFDFDCDMASQIAELLEEVDVLPCGPTFGRHSNPASHRLFRCDDAGSIFECVVPKDLQERIGAPKTKLVEVRGNDHYTVMPGSVHESGEPVQWDTQKLEFPSVCWAEAKRLGGLIGFLTVIATQYGAKGSRNDVCIALAGTLVAAGLDGEVVDRILYSVARNAGDEEASTRMVARRTEARQIAGAPNAGLTRLCELLDLEQHKKLLFKWLHPNASSNQKPVIHLLSGQLAETTTLAENTLIQAGAEIYQRGGELVRVCRIDQRHDDKARTNDPSAKSGLLVITAVSEPWLRNELSRIAAWVRPTEEEDKPIDPPLAVVRSLLSRKGQWKFPVIAGIVETPTLRSDFSVLQEPGYDEASGLYFDPGHTDFGKIKDQPSKAEAEEARDLIVSPIRCFPFVPDEIPDGWQPEDEEGLNRSASRSVVLSALLTGLMRRSLRCVPLHGIDAPTRGTGKSLIADLVSLVVSGRPAHVTAWTGNEAEDEKRLFAALLQGDGAIFIDNIERPVESAALCAVLTSPTWNSRVLKESRNVAVSTAAVFMATGNNLTFKGDMARRVVLARIDPRTEKPEERSFPFDARNQVMENRVSLVRAGLTILRAYAVAGRPMRKTVRHVGSFEDWTFVREALVWLGEPDPADTRKRVLESDPDIEELAEVMAAWENAFGDRPQTMRAALDFALESKSHTCTGDDRPRRASLLAAFEQVSFDGKPNARSLGRWLKRRADRLVEGTSFKCVGKDGHKTLLFALSGQVRSNTAFGKF